ncbi:MAG: aromatic ring-hydroxylating dioxygenase subunit alpha [Roseiarcus sp.]|uniref:aromatic ring-hydroxylating oxygenase subunit alpha n=1 Tax=Roseiarcus sp. TaxID=1969460 RepID=UPI003BAFA2F9
MDGKNEGAKDEMLAELRRRRPGHTLPRRFYGDPVFHELDLENLWRREWLFAGHDCEIPMPGDYFTLQLGDDPIVVVRGRDGSVRAFHNTCRHRGSRICSAEKGSAARLVCPYHNWSYELDGRLLFARDMGANFDRSQQGLKAVACENVGGYVWICVAEEPPDFTDFLTNTAPYLAPHDLSAAKIAAESTIVENGNWKLVWENNRECYHCAPNHPELCRTFPDRPTVAGIEGVASDPLIAEHWRRCEAAGMPSRFTLSEDGQWRVARMPLVGEAVSYTMSGRAAVSRGLSDHIAEPRIGSMLLFHYPSTWNHLLGDHAVTFRVLPLGPKQTQVTTKWLVHRDAVEGVDYSIDELTAVWNATNDQDRRIVEENQRGLSSPAYEPGPYSPVHEGGVMQFVEWYCGATERALSDGRTRPQAARKTA